MFRFPTALAVALTLTACQSTAPRTAAAFQQLVSLMGLRLALAEQVAAAKFARDLPIQDAEREKALLTALMKRGESMAVPESATYRFFNGQIAASKQLQEAAIARWRAGAVPPPPQDVARALRPKIDRIDHAILDAIATIARNPIPPPARIAHREEAAASLRAQGFPAVVVDSATRPLVDL
jgi:chorismate mutase-like protein